MKKKMYFDECYRQEAHDYVIESMMKTAERYHCQIEFHFIPHGETEINIDNGLYSKTYFLDWEKPIDLVEAISDIWTDFFAGPEDVRCNYYLTHYHRYTPPSLVARQPLTITNVIFNKPATIVFWSDGTKTVVKTQGEDEYDPEKGLAMAIAKKHMGNNGGYYNEFDKWLGKYRKERKKDIEMFSKFVDMLNAAADRIDNTVAEKKPMTCREKLAKEYPGRIRKSYLGGCGGCPHSYGYASIPDFCWSGTECDSYEEKDEICRKCWDRPVGEGYKK